MKQVLTIKTDTSNYTANDIRLEIQECVKLLTALGYQTIRYNNYEVDTSTRRTKNYGTCQCIGTNRYRITLNANYIKYASSENVHNTIMHEVLHSLPGCMNHGPNWKAAAANVNAHYQYATIQRLGNDESYNKNYLATHKETYKFALQCDNCKQEWYYKRESKVTKHALMGVCTCPHCNTHKFIKVML